MVYRHYYHRLEVAATIIPKHKNNSSNRSSNNMAAGCCLLLPAARLCQGQGYSGSLVRSVARARGMSSLLRKPALSQGQWSALDCTPAAAHPQCAATPTTIERR